MAKTDEGSQGTASARTSLSGIPGGYPSSPVQVSTESNQLSLSQAIHARRSEYVRPKTIRIKVGTWNTAAFKGTEKDLGGWFVRGQGISDDLNRLYISQDGNKAESKDSDHAAESTETVNAQENRFEQGETTLPKNDPGALPGGDDVGLYLLGLQEVVDVSSASENFRPYTDPEPAARWKSVMEAALPEGYVMVAEQQLIGLLLLIYASPDVAPDVKAVSTTSVGTGLMGYMGNKGAVTARIVLGETTRLVFVNCHLAAGADKTSLERRNWDYGQITSRTKFEPIRDAMDLHQTTGEVIDDADFAFWAGDLNYRLADIPGEDVRRLLMLHTRNEYDLSHPSSQKIENEIKGSAAPSSRGVLRLSLDSLRPTSSSGSQKSGDSESGSIESGKHSLEDAQIDAASDPASLQTTLHSLLAHDELSQQIENRKAFFDGWREGPINFLPTYKYDPGSVGVFDSSEKKRAPSWCDRILYRTRRDKLAFESQLAEEAEAARKDAQMKKDGIDEAGKDEELLYDYDPDEDAADDQDAYDEVADLPEGVVITKEGFEDEVELEYYTAHQRVLSSDHKPLDAVFRLKYNCVVPQLRAKVHQEVARELDKAENEGRPSVTVIVDRHHAEDTETCDEDPTKFEGVDFGHVRYAARKQRTLTIANTGRVPATISFVDRPIGAGQESGPSPAWLKVDMDPDEHEEPPKYFTGPRTLEPGDVSNVELKVRILGRQLTRALNEGIEQLDDILVLRVENGRDHFIPVHGKWLESSLGKSIDKLIRLPEGGIRRLQRQIPKGRSQSNVSSEDMPVKWSAPRELFRLTDATEKLVEACIAEWEMTSGDKEAPWATTAGWPFTEPSWTTSFEERHELTGAVCEALDTNTSIGECMPAGTSKMAMLETVASFLVEYLESLPEGIITENLWAKLKEAQLKAEQEKQGGNEEELRTQLQEILSGSPPHNRLDAAKFSEGRI
ncbi:DNase I-like protein [Myriangium duriaei CBS 260.36]|uniref:DNase I-like protein n=1 Tax=Myriangium duriaei CBS 260.36 TaxID=1168546 RepID=A0A9P4JAD9_9PEZI|nr:DNase I-like protein [Myriangium duriaei CBS 260.36]